MCDHADGFYLSRFWDFEQQGHRCSIADVVLSCCGQQNQVPFTSDTHISGQTKPQPPARIDTTRGRRPCKAQSASVYYKFSNSFISSQMFYILIRSLSGLWSVLICCQCKLNTSSTCCLDKFIIVHISTALTPPVKLNPVHQLFSSLTQILSTQSLIVSILKFFSFTAISGHLKQLPADVSL